MEELSGLKVLDLCCGTGFLSYHILKKAPNTKLSLVDMSQVELTFAENLLESCFPKSPAEFLSGDAATLDKENYFDIIVGNSYLHHFVDPIKSIRKISCSLKPGGVFISLHEPLVAALGWESANPALAIRLFLRPQKTIEDLRNKGNYPTAAQDVWIFTHKDLRDTFIQSGSVDIKSSPWGIFRPLLVAKHKLHLSPSKPKLNVWESAMLGKGIRFDTILSRFCPPGLFGSCAILGRKPL